VLPPPERSFKTDVGVLGSLVGLAALAVLVSAFLMARTLLRRRRTRESVLLALAPT
jgi:predicted MFS family arabinose efflux permease